MTHSANSAIAVALVDVALVLLVRAALIGPARRLRLPIVVAEIAAGLILGPSVLGLLPGHLTEKVFPTDVRPMLAAIAEVGLVLFMFLVGWDLEGRHVWRQRRAVAGVAVSSMALPLGGGVLLALWLYEQGGFAGGDATRLSFILFIGVAMSITAFPVLARLIVEHGLQRVRVGAVALSSAAAADAVAWCLLAVVSTIVTASGKGHLIRVAACSVAYLAILGLVVRPLLRRAVGRWSALPGGRSGIMSVVAAGILVSAFAASWIGLDCIFGAFAFGLAMPKDAHPDVAAALRVPMEHVVALLMPIFFIVTGLSVDLTRLGGSGWLCLLATVAVACTTKWAGAVVPGRLSGLTIRESVTLGVLMNTRGLTELVILNVGLSLGVLNHKMFSIMALMAIATTGMAGPLLCRAAPAPPRWRPTVVPAEPEVLEAAA